ncbi:unnamed protein product [Schistosoma margrebowiei]|uniref:Uncharacterized protein n=1 Tax=Schistosoma margrebowiei TaxID=48269 RepID=A0A183M7H7_9TREM|nr:unnamed protein product [Schistosoma margrebowiei]
MRLLLLENQSWFKAKLVDIAHHFHSSGPKQRSILTSQHFKSLKELRNNADIIILKPDKGSGVVIMNKLDYKNKIESILSDKSKFLADVDFDGLRKLKKKVNSNLVKLLNMNAINKDEFNLLKPMGSAYPNLYGLPKIHKPNTPLRPILSMCRSPIHNLAKWLTKLFNPIRNQYCKYSLTDSFELINYLKDINIKTKTMCSFDVNTLFTNVPLMKTIDILCDFISSKNLPLPFPVKTLKDLLLLCTDNVKFTFEGEHFRQIDGVAMGSPLGPLLADVFMGYVENLVGDSIRKIEYTLKDYSTELQTTKNQIIPKTRKFLSI